MIKKLKNQWQYHAMLIPGVILTIIFSYIPLYGVVIAFQKYNVTTGFHSPWVGFENFAFLFNQPNFLKVIWNTFYISFFKIALGIIVPVAFALLLNEVASRKLKRVYQTLIYMPNFMSWVIMAGILAELLSKDGIINSIIMMLGGEAIPFLSSPKIFPWTIIFSDCWKEFGFGTVVYLAALTSIDPELYEAARVDGASRWRQTISITLPLMLPIIILKTILSLGNILNAGFDQVFNLYSPIVYESGDIIDTYVYRLGIEHAQYSISTAVGLFKSVVSAVLIGLSQLLADKAAGYRVF